MSPRGYLPTGIPSDRRLGIVALADDVLSLIDHLGPGQVVVLGHDWGASTAHEQVHRMPGR
ncbi:alpha/beta fold hydrolase [Salipiger thiooxidans]|uniref:alpha/beta fold hydrolase n=1 Tax=Salipiger thiooxidans TaxID=282683 RepID=UPI001A8CA598|nr:alpha/beta fold hydrolase [Salipiger thiooxidans]